MRGSHSSFQALSQRVVTFDERLTSALGLEMSVRTLKEEPEVPKRLRWLLRSHQDDQDIPGELRNHLSQVFMVQF